MFAAPESEPPRWDADPSGAVTGGGGSQRGARRLSPLKGVCPAVPRALNVTLVLQCERRRFVRVGLAVPLLGTVAELREMVAREGRIPPEQVTAGGRGDRGTRPPPQGHRGCRVPSRR